MQAVFGDASLIAASESRILITGESGVGKEVVALFVVLTDVPLLSHPWAMALVALLGNVGIASAGTLVSAWPRGSRRA